MRLNKPVKWIESRRENFQATIHGRAQVGEVSVAVKNDGTLLGLKYDVTADLGAYHQLLTPMNSDADRTDAFWLLQDSGDSDDLQGRLHEQDGDRRLPRRGPPRSDLPGRTGDGPDRGRTEYGPCRDCARISPSRTSSRSPRRRGCFTTAAITKGALQGPRDRRLQKAARGAKGRARAGAIDGRRSLDLRRNLRDGAFDRALPAGGRRRDRARRADGQSDRFDGHLAARPGEETSFAQIVGDMLGVSIDDVLVIHGDADRAIRHRNLRQPRHRGGRGALAFATEKWSPRRGRSPRTCSGPTRPA